MQSHTAMSVLNCPYKIKHATSLYIYIYIYIQIYICKTGCIQWTYGLFTSVSLVRFKNIIAISSSFYMYSIKTVHKNIALRYIASLLRIILFLNKQGRHQLQGERSHIFTCLKYLVLRMLYAYFKIYFVPIWQPSELRCIPAILNHYKFAIDAFVYRCTQAHLLRDDFSLSI